MTTCSILCLLFGLVSVEELPTTTRMLTNTLTHNPFYCIRSLSPKTPHTSPSRPSTSPNTTVLYSEALSSCPALDFERRTGNLKKGKHFWFWQSRTENLSGVTVENMWYVINMCYIRLMRLSSARTWAWREKTCIFVWCVTNVSIHERIHFGVSLTPGYSSIYSTCVFDFQENVCYYDMTPS